MDLDQDGSLKLIALCVALAAYVSNVRRDKAKRCTTLKDEIKKLQKESEKSANEKKASAQKELQETEQDLSRKKAEIRFLLWGDMPLVAASLAILVQWIARYVMDSCAQWPLIIAVVLFSIAVLALAVQHLNEWLRTFRDWREDRRSPPITDPGHSGPPGVQG